MAYTASTRTSRVGSKGVLALGAALVLLVAMAVSTKVVQIGSEADQQPGAFSMESYGASEFPKVRSAVEGRAIDAQALAAALASDKNAAAKQYGVPAGVGPEFSVKFTGVAGQGKSGTHPVTVAGLPDTITVRVQTGPAINGTDLRDATGTIAFGQFTNQIEYQNAGAALNNEMKKQVLAGIDTNALPGKTLSVVGAFKLINPKLWMITPVRIEVQ